MQKKRLYEKPAMRVFEFRQQPRLLAGSPTETSATIDSYEVGGVIW